MDQVCGEVRTGRVRDGQPQYDQLPGGGRSTLTTDHSNDKLFIFLGIILLILISALLKENLL